MDDRDAGRLQERALEAVAELRQWIWERHAALLPEDVAAVTAEHAARYAAYLEWYSQVEDALRILVAAGPAAGVSEPAPVTPVTVRCPAEGGAPLRSIYGDAPLRSVYGGAPLRFVDGRLVEGCARDEVPVGALGAELVVDAGAVSAVDADDRAGAAAQHRLTDAEDVIPPTLRVPERHPSSRSGVWHRTIAVLDEPSPPKRSAA